MPTERLDAVEAATAADPAFAVKNRDVLRWTMAYYVEKARAEDALQIMAADNWIAAQLTVRHGRKGPRQHVWNQRHGLEKMGYVRNLRPEDVTRRDLVRMIEEYAAVGRKPPTVVEIQAPGQSTS